MGDAVKPVNGVQVAQMSNSLALSKRKGLILTVESEEWTIGGIECRSPLHRLSQALLRTNLTMSNLNISSIVRQSEFLENQSKKGQIGQSIALTLIESTSSGGSSTSLSTLLKLLFESNSVGLGKLQYTKIFSNSSSWNVRERDGKENKTGGLSGRSSKGSISVVVYATGANVAAVQCSSIDLQKLSSDMEVSSSSATINDRGSSSSGKASRKVAALIVGDTRDLGEIGTKLNKRVKDWQEYLRVK